jgi:hypothetical protein
MHGNRLSSENKLAPKGMAYKISEVISIVETHLTPQEHPLGSLMPCKCGRIQTVPPNLLE